MAKRGEVPPHRLVTDRTVTAGDVTVRRPLLLQRNVTAFTAGMFASSAGNRFHELGTALLVYRATGSSTSVALALGIQYGVQLVFAPLGGMLADRFDRGRILMWSSLAGAVAAFGLAFSAFTETAVLPVVYVVSAIFGVLQSLSVPSMQAIVPALVRPNDLSQMLAVHSITFNASRMLAPIAATWLLAAADSSAAFAANAISYLILAGALCLVRTRPLDRSIVARPQLVGRWYEPLRNPQLRALMVVAAVGGVALDPAITLAPSLSEVARGDLSLVGPILSVFGVGSALVAFGFSRIRAPLPRGAPMRIGAVVMVVSFSLPVLHVSTWSVLLGFGVAGVGYMLLNTDCTAVLQESLDDRERGRVMALWSMCFFGARPVAGLVSGVITDSFGPSWGMVPIVAALASVAVATRPGGSLDPIGAERPAEIGAATRWT